MNRRKQASIFQSMKSRDEMLKQSARKKTDGKVEKQEGKL